MFTRAIKSFIEYFVPKKADERVYLVVIRSVEEAPDEVFMWEVEQGFFAFGFEPEFEIPYAYLRGRSAEEVARFLMSDLRIDENAQLTGPHDTHLPSAPESVPVYCVRVTEEPHGARGLFMSLEYPDPCCKLDDSFLVSTYHDHFRQ